jgi:ABC-type thiamine transport system substrate-binding protein
MLNRLSWLPWFYLRQRARRWLKTNSLYSSGADYLAPEIAKDFANKFACNINVIPYDDAQSMLAAINRGEASQCDLVLPP